MNNETDPEIAKLEERLRRLKGEGPAKDQRFWTDFTRNVRLRYDEAQGRSGRHRFWLASAILTTTLASLVAVALLQPHHPGAPPSAALAIIAPSNEQADDDLDESDEDEWEELDNLDTAALERVATAFEQSRQKRAFSGATTGAAN